MPEIRVEALTKRFNGFEAVKRVNFSVGDGEYVSIIGPSGCGKTTLLRMIAGIIRQDEGHVYFDGKLIDEKPIEERGIGYVFQNIALFPHMSVWENISYGPRAKGYELTKIGAISIEMLEMMKLSERYENYPMELSGGMRQKTAVARSLASEPNVLLLDEPLSMLDAKVRKILRFELRKIVKDLSLTAIHVTHDQEEAMAISDRIFVMRRGELVESGRPDELYFSPKRIFTAYFLGESNIFEGKIIGTDGIYSSVDIGGTTIRVRSNHTATHSNVVIIIRPELIDICERNDEGILASVKDVVFEGMFFRYELETECQIRMIVKYPSSGRRYLPGEKVRIVINPEVVRIYPRPEGGLNNEIKF